MRTATLMRYGLWALAAALVGGYVMAQVRVQGRVQERVQDRVQARVDAREPQESDLTPLYKMPDFALTDHTGEPFASDDLEGTAWVGFIFLTNCPTGACPQMIGKMVDLQEGLADVPVEFVSFSIDPERDTPEVLSGYAERMAGGAPGDRWHLLTGDTAEQMEDLASQMRLGVGEDWTHSTRFLLVDANGFVRGLYGNNDAAEMDRLRADAERLVAMTNE